MKNLLYISLSVLFGVFMIIASCKKDPEPVACTTCQKVSEAKDYFAFKVGSWWVYEEETSLERDSIYVTAAYFNTAGYAEYAFDVFDYSSRENYYHHFWSEYINNPNFCNSVKPVSGKCLYVKRNKYKPGDYVGEGTCFFVAYKQGDYSTEFNVNYANNKVIIEDIFSSFPLGQFTFEKTIKIHELSTFIEGCQATNHYFSKGVGLIRKELIDSNQVWNLVNYHIEP